MIKDLSYLHEGNDITNNEKESKCNLTIFIPNSLVLES